MKKTIRRLAWWFVVPAFITLFSLGMILIVGLEHAIKSQLLILAGISFVTTAFLIFPILFVIFIPNDIWQSVDELREEKERYKEGKKELDKLRVKYVKYFENKKS